MEWLSKALDFIKLPLRYVWAITLATGLLLFLPATVLRRIHADKFVQDFGTYIGLVFLVFAVILLVHLASGAYAKIHTWLQRNKRLSRALSELLELDRTEKSVLREFYLQGQNTLQLPINQTTVSGLITKGILCRAGSIGEQSLAGMLFPVKLAEHVKKHLKRDLIDLPPEPWSTQQIELLIEKRPSFLTEIQDHNELFHKGWPL